MQLLDSRASRMSPNQALLTLHADYIGGQHANYRKWYFAAQLNLDDAVGQSQNPGLQRLKSSKGGPAQTGAKSLDSALNRWRNAMNNMSHYDRLRQIALYLLCWGEAGNVRFVPECLCFIFKCADDYYRSPECQNRMDPVPEGLYLNTVIKPLYRFMRDQGYEVVDGKFVRKEKDHDEIIGYDDVNQLFWYPEGLSKIMLNDNVCSGHTVMTNLTYDGIRRVLSMFHLRNASPSLVALTGIVCFSRHTMKNVLLHISWSTSTACGFYTSQCTTSTLPITLQRSTHHISNRVLPHR